MLKNCVWREVTKMWVDELGNWPKLCVLKELVRGGFEVRCVGVRRKMIRRILKKLRRGGDSRATGVQVGRWRGLKREKRMCTDCDSGEVANVKHFLMRCKAWNGEKGELKKVVTGFKEVEEERNVAWILTWYAELSPSQEVWKNCGQ